MSGFSINHWIIFYFYFCFYFFIFIFIFILLIATIIIKHDSPIHSGWWCTIFYGT